MKAAVRRSGKRELRSSSCKRSYYFGRETFVELSLKRRPVISLA
jgi:hypothetical protein